jgi:hypothetical protein
VTQPYEIVQQSRRHGNVCAGCGAAIEPGQPAIAVTLKVLRPSYKADRFDIAFGAKVDEAGMVPAKDVAVQCLACETCYTDTIAAGKMDPKNHRATICPWCERPLTFTFQQHWRDARRKIADACCRDCENHIEYGHVKPKSISCVVCNTEFVPKRSDATTCSNRCRQQLFRLKKAGLYVELPPPPPPPTEAELRERQWEEKVQQMREERLRNPQCTLCSKKEGPFVSDQYRSINICYPCILKCVEAVRVKDPSFALPSGHDGGPPLDD